jgi:glycosyltransferase involved in cell wall biosynthesis
MNNIRLHIPGIPYTITRDEYSHDAYTGKVQRFSPMMCSLGFEVYHYGVETSESGANKDIQLFTKEEWTKLRIESLIFLEPKLTLKEATQKNSDPTMILSHLSNVNTPLTIEFNKRLFHKLKENYRSKQTDIFCCPLAKTYYEAINELDIVKIETGIGYENSYLDYRIFESYSWMSKTLGIENKNPSNYWFVIPNYFNINEFKLSLTPTPLKVGFLGRLVSTKGCHVIVEIAKKFPNIQFVLCGSGDPTPFLKVPNIVYKNPIHGVERSEYLGSCIALLHPTVYLEPFGNSNVEAQLCGTPVISSDCGGMVETIENYKTGLLCHTLADYCCGVQMAIDGVFDRKYIHERAVNMFDMYKIAYRYEYVFKSILDIYKPEKNGWYSPDVHIKTLILNNGIILREPRIYIFLVYYGNFPNYFQLYLDSLSMNIDILTIFLVTDINIEKYNIPSNLIFINLSIQNIRERVTKLIYNTYDIIIQPETLLINNYKLTDIKIMYLELFDDILNKYNVTEKDYVGWGDCDLIYGKLSNFIKFEENYEILGGWHGHFVAIKNTKSFKTLFKKIPNYVDLITNSKHFAIDEIAYREPLKEYLEKNNFKMFYANAYFCDIVPPCYYHKFRPNHNDLLKNFFDVYNPTQNISYLFFDKNNTKLSVKYDDSNEMKEVLYCHLQKRNMELRFEHYENNFYINEDNFSIGIKNIKT